jgi:hypothetical protein
MEGRPILRGARWIVAVVLLGTLSLPACGEAPSDEHVIDEPATIEHPEGSDVARVTLTESAAERIAIQTVTVEESGKHLVVPSAAVLVDPDGVFWVYTSPEPLLFIRHEITIDHESEDRAFLSAGPPVGTDVATVGVAELYGAEYEIGQ